MCFGVPMQVVRTNGLMATCEGSGRTQEVNLALIGEVSEGTDLLVYLGSAVRVLTPQEATQITDAIGAIEAAAQGRDFEHLIQDLIDREPELPEHLRPQAATPERASGKNSPEPDPSRSKAERGSKSIWEEDNEPSTAESSA